MAIEFGFSSWVIMTMVLPHMWSASSISQTIPSGTAVEISAGFVGKYHRRTCRYCPGNRCALLLTSAHFTGTVIRAVKKQDLF